MGDPTFHRNAITHRIREALRTEFTVLFKVWVNQYVAWQAFRKVLANPCRRLDRPPNYEDLYWSPAVNFRPQFQFVEFQLVAEVLRWLHPNFEMEERAADGTHDDEWHIVNG